MTRSLPAELDAGPTMCSGQWGPLVAQVERLARALPVSVDCCPAITPNPGEAHALLCAMATAAGGFTAILDVVRAQPHTLDLRGLSATLVELDQAAAAAQDLHDSAQTLTAALRCSYDAGEPGTRRPRMEDKDEWR